MALRTPPKRSRKLDPPSDAKIVNGLELGKKFRANYLCQTAEFLNLPGCKVKQPTTRRPPRLALADLECVKVLGKCEHGRVLLVRTTRKSHEHDLAGSYFALKAYDKKRVRSLEASTPSDKHAERSILSEMGWFPFVNNVVDVFHDARNMYMLLEHIPCGTLRSLIRDQGPFDATKASFYFSNIVCALAYLETYNIVHRNLNPDNILVGADGYLCLSEFTKATVPSDDQGFQYWIMVGSLEYMAPECLNPIVIGPLTYGATVDWWSSGCIFFEMLTGEQAFPIVDDRPGDTLDEILSGKVNWPVNLRIGPKIKLLVESFLALHPSKRLGYNGYEEVAKHAFFGNIKWNKIEDRLYIAPYIPPSLHVANEWHRHPMPRQTQIPGLKIAKPPILLAHDGRFPLRHTT